MDRRIIRTAGTTCMTGAIWSPVLGWPVLGAFYPALAPGRLPELHTGLIFFATVFTLGCLVPRFLSSHAKVFLSGMRFGAARRTESDESDEPDDADDGTLAKVVVLHPRHRR
jgi:hypothetical protein